MAIIRQQTRVFNKPIGVVRADAGGARVGQAIAGAADTMARIAFQDAAREAEKRGIETAKSVSESQLTTINPETGKPEALKIPDGFGRVAADAYQRVVDARFENAVDMQLRLKAKEISLKYEYNADAYADVFKDYIADLSKNAGGQYGTFIESTGAKYLALTSLNIKERAIAKARSDLGQSTLDGFENKKSQAYEIAKTGGYLITDPQQGSSEVADLASKSVSVITQAVGSNLLKTGSDRVKNIEISTEIAKGAVEHINGLTINGRPLTSSERNLVTLAVRTGNANIKGVPKALRSNIEAMLEYVSPENANAVLRHQDAVASDYNAVEANMIESSKAMAEQQSLLNDFQFDTAVTAASKSSMRSSYFAFNPTKTDNAMNPFAVSGVVSSMSDNFRNVDEGLRNRVIGDSKYSDEDYNSDLTDLRKSLLKPLLVSAAAQGNVSSLKAALANPYDKEILSRLNDKQVELVMQLQQASFYNQTKDSGFINSTLENTIDREGEALESMKANYELLGDVSEAAYLAKNGRLNPIDAERLRERLLANLSPDGFTEKELESELSRLNISIASGVVNEFVTFDSAINSYKLNLLSRYVLLDGSDKTAPSYIQEFGDKILASVQTEADREAIAGDINTIGARYRSEETATEKARKLSGDITRILSMNGNPNLAADRKVSDVILNRMGLNPELFSSMDIEAQTELLQLFKSAPAEEGFIQPLEQLVSGNPVAGAESFIQMYALLSTEKIPGTDIVANYLGDSLSEVDRARLDKIAYIYKTEGGSLNEISARLRQIETDPKTKAFQETMFGGKTARAYTLELAGNDPLLAAEIQPLVEYYAGSMTTPENLKKKVTAVLDRKYPEAQFVLDTQAPVIGRSKYALALTMPNEEVRNTFVERVQAEMESLSEAHPDNFAIIPTLGSDQQRVFLRPDDTGGVVRYYVYYEDINNEIVPLMYPADEKGNYLPPSPSLPKGGETFFPSYTVENLVGDVTTRIADEKAARAKLRLKSQEAAQSLQFQMKNMTPIERERFLANRIDAHIERLEKHIMENSE